MGELRLRDVKKSFGHVDVIKGVDLDVKNGEFIVFVGPSGCGKSTLLRLIAGLEEITSGEIEFDGEVVNELPPALRGIAMVFQSYALYPHMTVYNNMAFGMKLAKANKEDIDKQVRKAAETLQLTEYLDRLPKQLSGGQRQRVAIGRAIVRNPKVFLFDEPLSNLDAALRVSMRIEIAKLHERMDDVTMIYVTHDQVEAMTLADRIVVLRAGIIEQVGSPMELYERPDNLFVAGFIGSPAMNMVPCTIEAGDGAARVRRRQPRVGRRHRQDPGKRRRPEGHARRQAGGPVDRREGRAHLPRSRRLCRASRRTDAALCGVRVSRADHRQGRRLREDRPPFRGDALGPAQRDSRLRRQGPGLSASGLIRPGRTVSRCCASGEEGRALASPRRFLAPGGWRPETFSLVLAEIGTGVVVARGRTP